MSRFPHERGVGRGGSPAKGGGGHPGGPPPASQATTASTVSLFDPSKPLDELVDKLAEEQAKKMPDAGGRDELKSNQLRRFFGEVKDLYRRLEQGTDYKTVIEPMFKMIRSKASYAWRNGRDPKIPRQFYGFIDRGIDKVGDEQQFRAFVHHFEAVVGFLYGLGKVSKS